MKIRENLSPLKQKNAQILVRFLNGAGGGSRTHTVLPPRDFKSRASAIPPHQQSFSYYKNDPTGRMWRYHPDLNRGIKVLQTFALPLGDGTIMERKTGFEPATFALARQRSTTEPLPHTVLYAISFKPALIL